MTFPNISVCDGNPISYYFEIDGVVCDVKTMTCDAPPTCDCTGTAIDAQVLPDNENCCVVNIYASLLDPMQNQTDPCDVKVVIVYNGNTTILDYDMSETTNVYPGYRVCVGDSFDYYFQVNGQACDIKSAIC